MISHALALAAIRAQSVAPDGTTGRVAGFLLAGGISALLMVGLWHVSTSLWFRKLSRAKRWVVGILLYAFVVGTFLLTFRILGEIRMPQSWSESE